MHVAVEEFEEVAKQGAKLAADDVLRRVKKTEASFSKREEKLQRKRECDRTFFCV